MTNPSGTLSLLRSGAGASCEAGISSGCGPCGATGEVLHRKVMVVVPLTLEVLLLLYQVVVP